MLRYPQSRLGFFDSVPFRVLVTLVMPLALASAAVGLSACKNNQVGRACFISGSGSSDGGVASNTVVGSPAIECESSICLHIAGETDNQCTARCSADSDCETSPESSCKSGFTCAIPVVTGSFCCERLCICRDFIPDAGTLADPAGCVASNPANECCNLEGRGGNSRYPLCH
jgi:hypothetical protein